MQKLFFVLLLAAGAFAQSQLNYTGWGDTCDIDGFGYDSLKYSKWFELSRYEEGAVIIMADDTASDGFDNDSIKFHYGYQLAYLVLNSSGVVDTLVYPVRFIVDTFSVNNADTAKIGDTTGTLTSLVEDGIFGIIDTSSVSGYACTVMDFTPRWGVLVRFWFKGLTGNKQDAFVTLRVAYPRRLGQKVVGR